MFAAEHRNQLKLSTFYNLNTTAAFNLNFCTALNITIMRCTVICKRKLHFLNKYTFLAGKLLIYCLIKVANQ